MRHPCWSGSRASALWRNPRQKQPKDEPYKARGSGSYSRSFANLIGQTGRYRGPRRDWWEEIKAEEYGLQLGAEPAAAKLDGYLRPGIATFYADKVPGRFLADHQLRTDPKGDVVLRQRFWNFEYEWPWPALVPPVLIYADLLALGDARCVEGAKRIYEKHLARLFEQG